MKLSKSYNLKALYPELARQWHPTNNGSLKPEQVYPKSDKKVWWQCEKGHQWIAAVGDRAVGRGCPYCSGRRVSEEYNLRVIHPELARQWHPTKNGNLTPEQFLPGSKKKVWWICEKGHEWEMRILARRHGCGCPYCSGNRVTEENNFLAIHPDLAKQWHPTKNGQLRPDQISKGSNIKVWWICEKGHAWKTTLHQRSYYYSGCPYCAGKMVTKEYNLQVIYPEIAKQWHPIRNGHLTPRKVAPGSQKKVWWICEKGHEWERTVYYRSYTKSGCPYCSGSLVCKDNSLKALYPRLAKQWHPTKNKDLRPAKVLPRSKKKVWWRCEKGHVWRAVISSRVIHPGCPYCLKEVNPTYTSQWHPGKNGNLTPNQVPPGSGKKVWWKCEKGHEWKAVVPFRSDTISRCPYCSKKRPNKEYNLLKVHPDLAKQWHPTKNGNLTPEQFIPGSSRKVWWICEKGHEFAMPIYSRRQGGGCPYCSGAILDNENNFLKVHPDLAKQWHPTKNGNIKPEQFTPGSKEKVWWICEKGHEWEMRILSRRHGSGCPYCQGRRPSKEYNLMALYPELVKQWHPTKNKNLTPDQVTPGSDRKVWWKCKEGHEWRASIQKRTDGRGCPYCAGKRITKEYNLQAVHPIIARQWHPTKNHPLTPAQISPFSKKKVWWQCKKGHKWKSSVLDRSKGIGCPYCSRRRKLFRHL